MTIAELKSKWNKEKSSYVKKEIGDGTQKESQSRLFWIV